MSNIVSSEIRQSVFLTDEAPTLYEIAVELAELRAFKQEWEQPLIMLTSAIVALTKMAPPGVLPPQVKALVDQIEGK